MMTTKERAAVIIDDLNSYYKLDPVSWLAAVLDSFEREIRSEYSDRDTQPLAMAAVADLEDREN